VCLKEGGEKERIAPESLFASRLCKLRSSSNVDQLVFTKSEIAKIDRVAYLQPTAQSGSVEGG
jgi:hypothetical protein